MTDRIKIYTGGSDKIIAKQEIEAVELKESNTFSKDELMVHTISGRSYPVRENKSAFLKHFDSRIEIYSSGKYLHLIPQHINGVDRIESNTFSKDKLRISMRSGKTYVIEENLAAFEKKLS
jgi:hypothetical protein